MNAPPGLVGLALALWGVAIGQSWLGVALGAALEGLRLVPVEAPLATRTAARIARTTLLLGLAALGYAAVARTFPHAIYEWLRWLPVLALPLPAVQRLAGGAVPFGERALDTTHAYAAVVLLAAGTGTGAGAWLYPAYALLVGWAIAARLPRERRRAATALLALGAGLGYGVHVGLAALQGQVEEWSTELFQELLAPQADAFRERTRIGDLGRIRLSDRIVMRIGIEGGRSGGLLLREAAFDRYRNGEWQNTQRTPADVPRAGDRWLLAPGEARSELAVRRTIAGGEGLLPLPLGVRAIEQLPAESLERMPTGAVRAYGVPRFAAFSVTYGGDGEGDAPPTAADLEVPEVLQPAIDRVLGEESLRHAAAGETLAAVRAFFGAKFAYSLELSGSATGAAPRTLTDFLLTDRKGHCEYFATATALMLRRAGVPARYAAGFSAQEYSPLEEAFVVRGRHAHAWAQAFVGGRWIEVDTTPSRWAEIEEAAKHGPLDALLDRLSWLVDRIVRGWLASSPDDALRLGGVLAGLAGVLAALALLARRKRSPRPARRASDAIATAWQRVESSLARAGHSRRPGETARSWAERLGKEPGTAPWSAGLADLARAYYVARFDPAAPAQSQAAFLAAADDWLRLSRLSGRAA